jgi:MFS family permease
MCGLTSSLGGAYLADRWEKNGNYMGKAYICILSAVLGIPTIALCTLVQSSFWFSLGMLGLEYLFAESWLGPSITMVINTISPENKGFAVSAYLFFATVAGTIATELLGVLQTHFEAKKHPELYGYILFAFVLFSYAGSIPFMWLAGRHYTAFKIKEDEEKARKKN